MQVTRQMFKPPTYQAGTDVEVPAATETASATQGGQPATSRVLWWVLCSLLGVLVVLRVPDVYADLQASLPQELSESIGDPDMQATALKIGTGLALAGYVGAMAIYCSLAALLEKRLFGLSLPVGRRHRAGLFFLTATLCTVPVQVYGILTSQARIDRGWSYAAYFVVVALVTPLLFRRSLRRLAASRVAVLFAVVGFMVALVSVA